MAISGSEDDIRGNLIVDGVANTELPASPLVVTHSHIWSEDHHYHHHQSLNREGRWGTTDDFATSFLHFSLFSTALCDLSNSRPVHSLMLSSHLFLCPPCLLPPLTVPCKMVLARPDERQTWPYHCSLRLSEDDLQGNLIVDSAVNIELPASALVVTHGRIWSEDDLQGNLIVDSAVNIELSASPLVVTHGHIWSEDDLEGNLSASPLVRTHGHIWSEDA